MIVLLTILSTVSITTAIIKANLPNPGQIPYYYQILDEIEINSGDLLIMSVFAFASYTNYKAMKISDERGVKMELMGSIALTLGFLISVILRFVVFIYDIGDPFAKENISHSIPSIIILSTIFIFFLLSNLGLGIYLVNIIINPHFAYRIPIPITNVVIYNYAGVSVYSKSITVPEIDLQFEDQLLSGALRAVSAIIEETLGSGANLDHFDAGKFQIYFHRLEERSITLVAISVGSSPYINRSMERFADGLPEEILDSLNKGEISNQSIQAIDDHLKTTFPYIRV